MPIASGKFLEYLSSLLSESLDHRCDGYLCDPLLAIIASCRGAMPDFFYCKPMEKQLKQAASVYAVSGVAGVVSAYFGGRITEEEIDLETERKIVALKMGFPRLPATTCALIMQGFGNDISVDTVRRVYASHGFAQGMKELAKTYDFADINRRINSLSLLLQQGIGKEEFMRRFEAVYAYITAQTRSREQVIRESGIKRSLFFHYWQRFKVYGLLGLAESGKELFRKSKIGPGNEARLVIAKLQQPDRANSFFCKQTGPQGDCD